MKLLLAVCLLLPTAALANCELDPKTGLELCVLRPEQPEPEQMVSIEDQISLTQGNDFADPEACEALAELSGGAITCEVEQPAGICVPSIFVGYTPQGGTICGYFLDHLDAERHYYHCQEGVAIMGAAIYQLDPSFVPVLSTEDFAARAQASNVGKSLEIYPDSGIVAWHASHREAEMGYRACTLTNFQYWNYLSYLMSKPVASDYCEAQGLKNLGWGPDIAKPVSESNGRWVGIHSSKYVSGALGDCRDAAEGGPSFCTSMQNYRFVDALGGVIAYGKLRHAGIKNQGRVHMDGPRCAELGQNLAVVYEVGGVTECRVLQDGCKRYE